MKSTLNFLQEKVAEIEPIHVQAWQLKLAKEYSPNYVRIIASMLSLAFDRAIILGLASKNPSRMVGNIKSKKVKIDFWTLDEFQKVISLLYRVTTMNIICSSASGSCSQQDCGSERLLHYSGMTLILKRE